LSGTYAEFGVKIFELAPIFIVRQASFEIALLILWAKKVYPSH